MASIEDAIRHALAAASPVEAAKIVERHWREELDHERWSALGSWLELIPAAVKRAAAGNAARVGLGQPTSTVVSICCGCSLLRSIRQTRRDTPAPRELADVHLFKGVARVLGWRRERKAFAPLETVRRLSPGREQIASASRRCYLALARHRSGASCRGARGSRSSCLLPIRPKPQFLARLARGQRVHPPTVSRCAPGRAARPADRRPPCPRATSAFMRAWGLYVQAIPALQTAPPA